MIGPLLDTHDWLANKFLAVLDHVAAGFDEG